MRARQTQIKKKNMQKPKKDYSYVSEMALENIEMIFDNLDIECENRYTYLTGACPIHGGENKTGFSFSLDRKTWKCWSTGNSCNEEYFNDIFGLIMGVKKITFMESIYFVCQLLNIDNQSIPKIDQEKLDNKKFCKKKDVAPTTKTVFGKECLSRLKHCDYFVSRGFKKDTLDRFQCGIAHTGKMTKRIVFPIVDMHDDIVAFSGRIIYDKCEKCGKYHEGNICGQGFSTDSKWKHSASLSKATVIYNLNVAYDEIAKKKELIVVEGIPDVMKLYQIGVKNVVCMLGTSISLMQIRLLLSIGYIISKVFLFGDNDAAGKNFQNKHTSYDEEDTGSLSRYFNVEKVVLDGYKDIGDMSDVEAIEFCERKGWL